MKQNISVIIPFFQRKEALLTRALESVFSQRHFDKYDIYIFVVDDESPVSARTEVAQLCDHTWPLERLRILEQSNRGPAGARNKGLDNVGNADYVAFLDSDDRWTENHLVNAITALEAGNDFYFADHLLLGDEATMFEIHNERIRIDKHPLLQNGTSLHKYSGQLFDEILAGSFVGTSTVVYRYSKFPSLRFCESLVNAGEDLLFWLTVASKTDKIVFSSDCECLYGEGVNVYQSSDWGTTAYIDRVHYQIKYRKFVERFFNLTSGQLAKNRQILEGLRLEFKRGILHALAHKQPIPYRLLLEHIRLDPKSFLFFDLLIKK